MAHSTAELILLVDDDALTRRSARHFLESDGYEVIEAADGEAALAACAEQVPTLVLMDRVMPGLDGVTALRHLPAKSGGGAVPVIIMSAADEAEQAAEALEAGAVDFVRKPIKRAELLARVRTRIQLQAAQRRLEQRSRVEAIVREAGTSFIEAAPTETDKAIHTSLERLRALFDADRAYVFQFEGGGVMSNTHETVSSGTTPEREHLQGVPIDVFPWWMEELRERGVVHIPDVANLPPEATSEREILEPQGIKSLVVVPLLRAGQVAGFIGFDSVRRYRTWTADETELLASFGANVMILLDRFRIESKLAQVRTEFERLTGAIPQAYFLMSGRMRTVEQTSPGRRKIWGDQPPPKDRDGLLETIDIRDRDRLNSLLDAAMVPREQSLPAVEVRTAGTGSTVWISCSTYPISTDDDAGLGVMIAEDITARKRSEQEVQERRERELETSARIQRDILLREPTISDDLAEIGAITVPSEQVDGDFFDTFQFTPDTFDLIVADVMGKGITGAFWGAAIKNQFLQVALEHLTHAGERLPAIADIVNGAHRNVADTLAELSSFTTLSYSRFFLRSHRLDYIDAGHMPIIHYHARTERCWLIKGDNVPLGFLADEHYEPRSVSFAPNDLFLFYSDGVVETINETREQYGEQRLIASIERNAAQGVQEIVRRTKSDVFAFARGMGFSDDLTIVAVRFRRPLEEDYREVAAVYPAVVDSVEPIRNRLEKALADYYLDVAPRRMRDEIVLALNEALVNIVEHGVSSPTDARLHVELGMHADWVSIRVTYPGQPFDWTRVSSPDVREMQERGYGTFIMNETMDSVVYLHDLRGGMMLSMVKWI